jgi:hypothetical protein
MLAICVGFKAMAMAKASTDDEDNPSAPLNIVDDDEEECNTLLQTPPPRRDDDKDDPRQAHG